MPIASARPPAAMPSSTSAASPGSAATATSAPRCRRASFRDVRAGAAVGGAQAISRPRRECAPPATAAPRRGPGCRATATACLPLAAWKQPISAARAAASPAAILGRRPGEACRSSPATRSPTPRRSARDLDDYRIIHFATHGIVTAPRPKCPAQPALLTSFGGERLGRAADLPRDLRPRPRRRPRHPVGLRHRRHGERRGDPRGRPGDAAAMSRSTGWCAPSSAPAGAWWSPATGRCPTTSTPPSG